MFKESSIKEVLAKSDFLDSTLSNIVVGLEETPPPEM